MEDLIDVLKEIIYNKDSNLRKKLILSFQNKILEKEVLKDWSDEISEVLTSIPMTTATGFWKLTTLSIPTVLMISKTHTSLTETFFR